MVFKELTDKLFSGWGKLIFLSVLISNLTALILITEEINIRQANIIQKALLSIFGFNIQKWIENTDTILPAIGYLIRGLDLVVEVCISILVSFVLIGMLFGIMEKIHNFMKKH